MTISSTSSTSSDTSILQLLESLLNNNSNATSTGSSTAATSDSAAVSNPGKLFSELEKLSKSNPTEFKKITAEIADQLKTAASNATDPNQASFLTQLANSFETASQSGNFSDLFPHKAQSTSESSTANQPYGPPPSNEAVNSIFSSALTQIQTDLNTSSSS
jgi:HSP90 family molecular chaperone